jgi:branched-subunit amino acid ABC-type transport system permease component
MTNKILQAILVTLVLCMSLFLFYPSQSELGKSFVVSSIYMMLRYAALVAGIILLLTRLFFLRKLSSSFIYIFLATLNMAICLSALVLSFFHQANQEWVHDCLLNGLVGVGMLSIAIIAFK